MRINFVTRIFRATLLIPFIILSCIISIHAQDAFTITVTPPTNEDHNYHFGVEGEGVEIDDLVYYRFSDGFYDKKVMSSDYPNAGIQRQFKSGGNYEVVAYLAKKGGTLDLIAFTEIPQVDGCLTCVLPDVWLSDESNIMLSTSWNSFFITEGEFIPGLTDDITSFSSTPDLPWFFVNLALGNSGDELPGDYLDFQVPDNVYDIKGVIINNEYISLTNSPLAYPVNASLSPSTTIRYYPDDAGDFIRFTLNQEVDNQINFYIILEGEPESEFAEYFLVGKLYDKTKGKYPIDKYELKIKPTQQPHDPNQIYSPPHTPCYGDIVPYIVDFQNLGDGEAINVDVEVNVDLAYFDIESVAAIESSHELSSYATNDNVITFTFSGINLPGTNQENPSPSYNETKGWVKFELTMRDCSPPDPNGNFEEIVTNGEIIFYGSDEFEQETPLNFLIQKPCQFPCYVGGIGLSSNTDNGLNASRISSSSITDQIPFSAKSYPTIVNDFITIETSLLKPGVLLEINFVDIAGRIWKTENISSEDSMIYKEELDVSDLPTGIYFLQVKHGDQLINQKIVKTQNE